MAQSYRSPALYASPDVLFVCQLCPLVQFGEIDQLIIRCLIQNISVTDRIDNRMRKIINIVSETLRIHVAFAVQRLNPCIHDHYGCSGSTQENRHKNIVSSTRSPFMPLFLYHLFSLYPIPFYNKTVSVTGTEVVQDIFHNKRTHFRSFPLYTQVPTLLSDSAAPSD